MHVPCSQSMVCWAALPSITVFVGLNFTQTKLIASNNLSCSKGLKDGSVISLTYPTLVWILLIEVLRGPKDNSDGRFCEIRHVIRECLRMIERGFHQHHLRCLRPFTELCRKDFLNKRNVEHSYYYCQIWHIGEKQKLSLH